MARWPTVSVALLTVALALTPVAPAGAATTAARAVSSTLYANFDADGNISFKFADGTPIGTPSPPGTVVPAGTYTIVLNNNGPDDLGDPHQFHLLGPGVNLVAGQAVQITWTATFQPASTYVYQDDFNPTSNRGVFGTPGSGATATTVPTSTGTTAGSTSSSTGTKSGTSSSSGSENAIGNAIPTTSRGALTATVSAAGKALLLRQGKAVATLAAGRYTLTVNDRSPSAGLTIGLSHTAPTAITGAAFTGRRTRTITLSRGQWLFFATPGGPKSYFLVTR